MGCLQGVLHILYGMTDRGLQLNLVELLDKEVAVFRVHDGFHARAEHFHTIFTERSVAVKLCTTVQGCLSAESQQNAVGAFLLDDFRHEMRVFTGWKYTLSAIPSLVWMVAMFGFTRTEEIPSSRSALSA